ncbi:MAG: hypothetical protein GY856_46895 [bacterium]|nr:hypothetical protein [bacterium]
MLRILARSLSPLLLLAAFAVQLPAAEVPDEPVLRIETGMHTARISRIDVDAAGRFLVTGSADKTVRVWDLDTGQLLRILRPPIGEGNEGRIYAVALSPDGAVVAAGGWTRFAWESDHSIYLFDRRTGRLSRRIAGLSNDVDHLTFSRDGSLLAATLGGAHGIRVFRARDGGEVKRDTAYGNTSYGADFDAAGRLVTTSYDGKIRLYNPDLNLAATVSAPGGSEPFGISFSPDGRRIAVGYHDSTRTDVLSGEDLRLLYSANSEGTNFDLVTVAWSADGTVLYAAGRNYYRRSGEVPIRRWTNAGRGPYRDLLGPRSTVMGLRALADGRLVFGSQEPAWGVYNAAGVLVHHQRPKIADPRNLYDGFRVDTNGQIVRFAYQQFGKRPALFSIPERRLVVDPPDDPNLKPPRTAASGIEVTGWRDTTSPKLNGKALVLQTHELSRRLAIAPDGESFLLGTQLRLRSFTRDGGQRWEKRVPGTTWAVNISGDGRLVIAAFGDGTIRWFRAADGEELLALFPHPDGRRWVLWTPGGYYDAGVSGEELIGWHLNNGRDQAADFYPVSHFRHRFHRPDVVDRVPETLDGAEAVRLADAASLRPRREDSVLALRPPEVTILAPEDGSTVSASPVEVRIEVRSPLGKPVTAVRAFVDGRPAADVRGIRIAERPAGGESRLHTLSVPIPARDCTVSVLAETTLSTSEPSAVKLRWAGPLLAAQPDLRVLAVGVSDYADPQYRLSFAARDAREVAASWERQRGRLYGEVRVRLLTDAEATRDKVMDGLEWLERETGADDVAVLFLSGHGVIDPGTGAFYFLGHDADFDHRRQTFLPGRKLRDVLANLNGKAVLFLDSCHAGDVFKGATFRSQRDVSAFINELIDAASGVVVFSASTGAQLSRESVIWGNGAFTEALLEALAGAADLDHDQAIMIDELALYLARRVRKLTYGLQAPTTAKPASIENFPLAMVPDQRR